MSIPAAMPVDCHHDFSDLEGWMPRPNQFHKGDGKMSQEDRLRRGNSWQGWIDQRRLQVANNLTGLARSVDALAKDFLMQGNYALPCDQHNPFPISILIKPINFLFDFPCDAESIAACVAEWNTAVSKVGTEAGFCFRDDGNFADGRVRSNKEILASDLEFSGQGSGKGGASKGRCKGHAAGNIVSYAKRIDNKYGCKGYGKSDGLFGHRGDSLSIDMTSANQPLLECIRRCLFPSLPVLDAELDKMLIHTVGDHFDSLHVDTARSRNHMGTLVICLPTRTSHVGRTLHVQHGGKEEVADLSKKSTESQCSAPWAAFNSSCTHEFEALHAGYRIELIYNLVAPLHVASPLDNQIPESYGNEISAVEAVMHELVAVLSNPMLARRPLGVLLKHEYPLASSWDRRCLKGVDCLFANILDRLCATWRLQPIILERIQRIHELPLIRIFRTALPDVAVYGRVIEGIVAKHLCGKEDVARTIEAFLCTFGCLEELPDITRPSHNDLPLSATWVELPLRPFGVALMDKEQGRDHGCEGFQHYFHVALMISTNTAAAWMLNSEFTRELLPPEVACSVALRAGASRDALTMFRQAVLTQNQKNSELVVCAAGLGDAEFLMEVLANGAPVDALDSSGQSALHKAIGVGAWRCVEILLEHGATVDDSTCKLLHLCDPTLRVALEKVIVSTAVARGDSEFVLAFLAVKQEELKSQEKARSSAESALAYEVKRSAQLLDIVHKQAAQLKVVYEPLSAQEASMLREAQNIRAWLRGRKRNWQNHRKFESNCLRLVEIDACLGYNVLWEQGEHADDGTVRYINALTGEVENKLPPQEGPKQWKTFWKPNGERYYRNTENDDSQSITPASWRLETHRGEQDKLSDWRDGYAR
jgi:ankyrin repeat protein